MSHPDSMLASVIWSDKYLEMARRKISSPEEIRRVHPHNKIVLTKGVFDLLHAGHLALFALIAELRTSDSGFSVVAVATDEVVRANKGAKRPYQSFEERSLQVAIHPNVDFVVANNSAGLSHLISALRPAIYVKGQDTALDITPGSPGDRDQTPVALKESLNPEIGMLRECHAKVIIVRDAGVLSTSELVRRITESVD